MASYYFNPRSPCGERLAASQIENGNENISIHAPRVGSDKRKQYLIDIPGDFNPRSPCGERLFCVQFCVLFV